MGAAEITPHLGAHDVVRKRGFGGLGGLELICLHLLRQSGKITEATIEFLQVTRSLKLFLIVFNQNFLHFSDVQTYTLIAFAEFIVKSVNFPQDRSVCSYRP